MNGFSVAIFLLLMASAAVQGLVTVGFIWVLWRFRTAPRKAEYCPKAAVILCLRGCDPFLEKCLESVLAQDYPDYELHIVVDSRGDPAWRVAQALAERHGAQRVRVEVLRDRLTTCSLKCSAVTQAVGSLDESIRAVALIDADTLAHPTWLRELIAPLQNPHVGAATGNRWYMPEKTTWGALVRYLWNAAAVVQMYWDKVCWGGTLAVKRSVLDDGKILDRWKHAFCEDTMLYRLLRERNMKVEFVPSLMMVNREDTTLRDCLPWIWRQLTDMRLYHPFWPLVLLHGFSTALILAATVAGMAVAATLGHWPAFFWCLGGLAAYELIMVSLLAPMEYAVRRIVKSQGKPTRWLTARTVLRLVPAIVLTQIVYTFALFRAQFAKNISWRGVNYRVEGPWNVKRLDDPAFHETPSNAAENHSL